MKLYYSPGACSLASRIALYELGKDAEFVRTDIRAKQTEDGRDFREINPLGYVPALQLDDGQVLLENPAILYFVANLKPGQLAPVGGGLPEARLHEALAFLSAELHKAFGTFFGRPEGPALDAATAKLQSRLDYVERHLRDSGDYWLGDTFSVVDAYAFVLLGWAAMFNINLDDRPNITAYQDRIAGRQTVQRALADEGLLSA